MNKIKKRSTILFLVWIFIVVLSGYISSFGFSNSLDVIGSLGMAIFVYASVPIVIIFSFIFFGRFTNITKQEKLFQILIILCVLSSMLGLGILSDVYKNFIYYDILKLY